MLCRFLGGLLALGILLAASPQNKPAAKPDINSAFQVELQKLPGIDKTLAKKIIANRPYESADDLRRAGVPPATIEKLKPLVVCSNAAHGGSPMKSKQSRSSPSHRPRAAH